MNPQDRDEIKRAVAEAVTETGVLTDAEVRRIVKEAVRETLLRAGIDPDDSTRIADDLRYVREWRMTTDAIKSKSILTLVGLLVTGLAAALWLGFKALVAVRVGN